MRMISSTVLGGVRDTVPIQIEMFFFARKTDVGDRGIFQTISHIVCETILFMMVIIILTCHAFVEQGVIHITISDSIR